MDEGRFIIGSDIKYIPPVITHRELFAAMAMQGLLACQEFDAFIVNPKNIARAAVLAADSLIVVLKEGEKDADK